MGALADEVRRIVNARWGGVIGREASLHFGLGEGRAPQQLLKNWLGDRGIPSPRVPGLLRQISPERRREVARAELRERLGGVSEAYLAVLSLWTADDSMPRLVAAALRCEIDAAREWLATAA